MSQKESILQWLKREPITALQALAHLRVMRLAARVQELRDSGHAIRTEIIPTVGGKHVAKYSLELQ